MTDMLLADLESWYRTQCNGDWEHSNGISIKTIDNPGWALSISLVGTNLEEKPFEEKKHNYENDEDWFICQKREGKFIAHGGPANLGRLIAEFLSWAKE